MNRALHLITDPGYERSRLLHAVQEAAETGVDWVQVRDHRATAAELFDLTRDVCAICHPRNVRVAVNDRVDVALAAGADGAQLGARSLPLVEARRIAPGLKLGASTHDRDSARIAQTDGADWLTFGHVFPTTSHPGEPARGLDTLAEIVQVSDLPVIAIGGIGVEQVAGVLRSGARGIAVISAILDAPDPAAATRALRRLLDA